MPTRHGLVETVFDGRYVKHWRGDVLCARRCSRKWHAKIIFFSSSSKAAMTPRLSQAVGSLRINIYKQRVMQALALSLLLLSSGGGLAGGAGARLLLQPPWSPQGYHRNGYDERRIECEPQPAVKAPGTNTIYACAQRRGCPCLKIRCTRSQGGINSGMTAREAAGGMCPARPLNCGAGRH